MKTQREGGYRLIKANFEPEFKNKVRERER